MLWFSEPIEVVWKGIKIWRKQMSYEHYGRIGDIWKHLPLCNFLKNENPGCYIESNAACPVYDLTHSFERDYGIYKILNSVPESSVIANSVFYKTIKNYLDNVEKINTYLGSPGLAINIMNANSNFIFCDLDKSSLDRIDQYYKTFDYTGNIELLHGDALKNIGNKLNNYPEDSFLHVDPYLMFEENDEGMTFFDLFLDGVKLGMKSMLWYGYENNFQKKYIYNWMKEKIQNNQKIDNQITCIELYLASIDENEVLINPGVVGCGIAVANLSSKSMNEFEQFGIEMVSIYKNSLIDNKYSGELIKDKFIL